MSSTAVLFAILGLIVAAVPCYFMALSNIRELNRARQVALDAKIDDAVKLATVPKDALIASQAQTIADQRQTIRDRDKRIEKLEDDLRPRGSQ